MTDSWPLLTLEDACRAKPQYGFTASAVSEPVGPHFIRTTDIANGPMNWRQVPYCEIDETDLAKYAVKDGDLLVSRMGTVGVSSLIEGDRHAVFASYLVRLRPDTDRVLPRFLKYVLQSPEWWDYVNAVKTGSVQPNLNARLMSSFTFRLPPLDEQRRIAGVLGSLDDLIEVNRGLMAAMEDLLAARFAEFGFDEPGNNRLAELIQVNPMRTKPKGDAAYIEMAALSETQAGIDRVARRPATGGARFINGDTLMARITPCLENGKIGFVDCLADGEVGVGSTEFIVLRSEPPFPLGWTYLLARSPRFRDHVVRHMTGTSGRQRCPADAVTEYRLRAPDQTQLQSFSDLANPLFEALRELRVENHELSKIRDELLPLLMSGRIRVSQEAAA